LVRPLPAPYAALQYAQEAVLYIQPKRESSTSLKASSKQLAFPERYASCSALDEIIKQF
jgi:hypothetical protein